MTRDLIHAKAMAIGESGQQWGEIASYRTMALLAAADENVNWRHVETHLQKSVAISTRIGAATETLQSLIRFSELLRRKGDNAVARTYSAKATEMAKSIGFRIRTDKQRANHRLWPARVDLAV